MRPDVTITVITCSILPEAVMSFQSVFGEALRDRNHVV